MIRGLIFAGDAISAIALCAALFRLPDPPGLDLDPSWSIALTHAFFSGRQFGQDVVFTFGPLGFLLGNTFEGSNLAVLVFWQAIKSLGFTLLLLSATASLTATVRWLSLAVIALFVSNFQDTLYLLVILLLAERCLRENSQRGNVWPVIAGIGLALLALIKFTLFLFASLAVVVVLVATLSVARRCAVTLGVVFICSLLGLWVLAGQHLFALPDYLFNSWHVTQGYVEAMGLEPPALAMIKALVVLILLSVFLCLPAGRKPFQSRTAVRLLVAIYALLAWKHGFIRAETHMGYFFAAMLGLVVLLPVLLPPAGRSSAVPAAILITCGLLALWGLDDSHSLTPVRAVEVLRERLSGEFAALQDMRGFRTGYDRKLRDLMATCSLRKTQALIGQDSVDVLGHDLAIVYLLGLNYSPRPVFQSYSVYTPELAELNQSYYLSDRAPNYVLQRLQTIDGRLVTLDDSLVLALLPAYYEFVHEEDGYLLWRRKQSEVPKVPPLRQSLANGKTSIAGEISLNQGLARPLWLQLHLQPTWLGRLRSLVYKPALVRLSITDEDGREWIHRLPLSQARTGFIVSPLVRDAVDYLKLVHLQDARPVRSFRIMIDPKHRKYFEKNLNYSLSAILLPESESIINWAIYRPGYQHFSMSPEAVESFAPPIESEIEGRPVMIFHAPSFLWFTVPANAHRVSGAFGFVSGAYSEGGQTQGATFRVVWSAGQNRAVLFERNMDPMRSASDRGLQAFGVELPESTGQLLLEITPWPPGNNGWCWTAWSEIKFSP